MDAQTELAEARAFQLRLAERIAAASEVLSNLAERKGETMSETDRPEPVPRPLFEAAMRILRDRESLTDCGLLSAHAIAGESWDSTAERIIRWAAGVRKEGAGPT